MSRRQCSDIGYLDAEPFIGPVVCEILQPAADQVIDHPNGIPTLEQQVDHMAADKTGAPGNNRDRRHHLSSSFLTVRTL